MHRFKWQPINNSKDQLKSLQGRTKSHPRLIAILLATVSIFGALASPAEAQEDTKTVTIYVTDSTPPVCDFPTSPATWSPDASLSYNGTPGTDGTIDLFTETSMTVGLGITWTDGTDACGDLVAPTGTVSATLVMLDTVETDVIVDCDLADGPGCLAGNGTPAITGTVTFAPGSARAEAYTGTLTLSWIP